jgi:hypothetical protein
MPEFVILKDHVKGVNGEQVEEVEKAIQLKGIEMINNQ